MRKYTELANEDVQNLLGVLANKDSSAKSYQEAMFSLGQHLGRNIHNEYTCRADLNFCVVCTVEDADYLAKGILEAFTTLGMRDDRLKLVCFWNARIGTFEGQTQSHFSVAPIIKEYREEIDMPNTVLVVVKSIISGACVVKTNLAALIDESEPNDVVVAAPVMFVDADKRLEAEFVHSTCSKFKFVTFAIDDEKGQDENVIPGIGGSVYQRLGFGDKNRYIPDIVKERRDRLRI